MIVISGVSSALGISLARLIAGKGMRVLGFSRRIERCKKYLDHPLIELRSAEINDEGTIRSICSGAHGVVHLAALSSPWGKYEDFYRINVLGTKSIVRAALRSNVQRFVHVSTPSIYFDFRDRLGIIEEDALPKRAVNDYASTKKMAEDVVDLGFLQDLPSVIIRPRAIFGPHDQTLFPRVLKACEKGGIPCFGKKSPLVDITYVDNVSHAIWSAINAPTSCLGEKYNITNGEPKLLWDILELLLTKLSIPMKLRKLPYSLAYVAALLSELKSKMTGNEPILTRYGVGVMAYSQTLSIEKAKNELGYSPSISLEKGIQRYVDWFQNQ